MTGQRFAEAAAGVTDAGPLKAALSLRDGLLARSEASFAAALTPDDPGGLAPGLRAVLAARMARRAGDGALAARFLALAGDDPALVLADPAAGPRDGLEGAILAYVDLVTADPALAGAAQITALRDAGMAEADIVRLAGLVAFVNFQLRLVHVLRLLEGGA